ncbi:MAG: hypothetical protein R3185_07750 [Candidatus Thermoplasmatota archaeon]|nr:hypothetical protein [Candidatus Thermoplasmatota archaeon]
MLPIRWLPFVLAWMIALTGCLASATPVSLQDGFEEDLEAWTILSSPAPDEQGRGDLWNLSLSEAAAASGNRSLTFEINATERAVTVWLYRPISGLDPLERYRAKVSVQGLGPGELAPGRLDAILYLGAERPKDLHDLHPRDPDGSPGENDEGWNFGTRDRLDKVEGWTRFSLHQELDAPANGRLFVGVGLFVDDGVAGTFHLDELVVDLR